MPQEAPPVELPACPPESGWEGSFPWSCRGIWEKAIVSSDTYSDLDSRKRKEKHHRKWGASLVWTAVVPTATHWPPCARSQGRAALLLYPPSTVPALHMDLAGELFGMFCICLFVFLFVFSLLCFSGDCPAASSLMVFLGLP